ncbi:MAG: tetratricopeptide repeat protein [Saprospiraceae bacterium]
MRYQFPIFITILVALTACRQTTSEAQEQATAITGDQALDDLNEMIVQHPEDPTLYAHRAEIYYDKEGYDEAIQDLQTALSMDSTNVDYHHLLADVYMDYFRSRLALRTMERAAALYPERIPTLLKLSEFQYILKQYDASLATVDKVLKLDSRNADAYFMLGMNFKDLGDTTRAINSFQTSVEIEPSQVDAWITLGRLHAAIKSPLAERYFDNAIAEGQGSVIPLHAKADYLRDQGDLAGALELYKEINRLDRQYEEAYFNAGLIYLKQDSLGKAYELFNIAVGVYPLYVKAYYFRGLTAEMQGNMAQARADYQHALNLVPDYADAQEALARVSGQ